MAKAHRAVYPVALRVSLDFKVLERVFRADDRRIGRSIVIIIRFLQSSGTKKRQEFNENRVDQADQGFVTKGTRKTNKEP